LPLAALPTFSLGRLQGGAARGAIANAFFDATGVRMRE
jgi:CO/xanthine dehydrogenase Mo-binding subunit